MKFIFIPLIVLFFSSSAKLVVRVFRGKPFTWQLVGWVFSWAGGIPSTHSAFITSSVYLIGKYEGVGPLFGFSFTVALIIMYNLIEAREQYELTQKHWQEVLSKVIAKITHNEQLWDMYGHTFSEVVAGVVFGVLVTFVLDLLL
ncbi:MAG: divergent PAP2 family protein [Patescibacteria group bacterium]